jgi:hypothetical protein
MVLGIGNKKTNTTLMHIDLSHYLGRNEIDLPKIKINPPIVLARVRSGASFASKFEDKIYITSKSPKLLGDFLFQFLHPTYVPECIPKTFEIPYFKKDINDILHTIDSTEKLGYKANNNTAGSYSAADLADSLMMHFTMRPEEMPDGLNFISRAWVFFEVPSANRFKIPLGDASPIDRLESRLRAFAFRGDPI